MRPLPGLLPLAAAALAAVLSAQVAEHANSGYKTPEQREKIAKTLGREDRDAEQKPKELVEALALKPGMTVVDLGTGVGYMLPWLSKAVGPGGKVVAQDIFPDFLKKARERSRKEQLPNVSFVKGDARDPNLRENSADLILTLDAYHHFDYPEQMLSHIRQALRKDGRLVLVDFYKNGFRDPAHIRLDADDVIKEVEAQGFRLLSRTDHTKRQYMAIFGKR